MFLSSVWDCLWPPACSKRTKKQKTAVFRGFLFFYFIPPTAFPKARTGCAAGYRLSRRAFPGRVPRRLLPFHRRRTLPRYPVFFPFHCADDARRAARFRLPAAYPSVCRVGQASLLAPRPRTSAAIRKSDNRKHGILLLSVHSLFNARYSSLQFLSATWFFFPFPYDHPFDSAFLNTDSCTQPHKRGADHKPRLRRLNAGSRSIQLQKMSRTSRWEGLLILSGKAAHPPQSSELLRINRNRKRFYDRLHRLSQRYKNSINKTASQATLRKLAG